MMSLTRVRIIMRVETRRLMPLHCTGFDAAARLWREFPGRVSAGPAGTAWDFTA